MSESEKSKKLPSVRYELYQKLRDYMKKSVLEYYKKYPERLGDQRSLASMQASMTGLEGIFAVLDEYNITRKEK